MKKIIALLTIIMLGVFAVGCGANEKNQVSDNNVEKNYDQEKIVEKRQEEEMIEQVLQIVEKTQEIVEDVQQTEVIINDEVQNYTVLQQDTKKDELVGEAEKALFSFIEAIINKDIESARKYMLYDDLDYPFSPIDDCLDYDSEDVLYDITEVEEISDDMKLININMKTQEEEAEEILLMKKVNDSWRLASGGVISRKQSVFTDDQVKDGEVVIYLKDIYHRFNGLDTYVISIVNNTTEKLNIGFVNNPAIIYENQAGKGYIEFDETGVVNPYSKDYMYFTVDATEGPVKSIILKEVMLGLQPTTSDVKVFIGEMIER
ncbi:MAG: hypothetical protein GX054_04705 [Clostridiales bacterium]|jgi:hypothetical protein|nr:hypothetical protein [Clostridiales bacterium]